MHGPKPDPLPPGEAFGMLLTGVVIIVILSALWMLGAFEYWSG